MEEHDFPRVEAPATIHKEDPELQDLAEEAFETISDRLGSNRLDAKDMGFDGVNKDVDEVLANDNTRSLDIRARPLENPKVTLWLKECPIWANDAWTDTIYPQGINSYNGKVTVTFDVRKF